MLRCRGGPVSYTHLDYNGYYDKFYVTPRGHIKWNITPTTILRGSAGLGYRSTNVITDNIGVLATGRHITFERPTALSAGAAAVRGPLNPGSAYGGYTTWMVADGGAGNFKALNRMEKALTAGGSLTQIFTLVKEEDATLS